MYLINEAEAKTRFFEVIDQVIAGEEVIISILD